MMILKVITSALIISLASWLAGKKTILAGFFRARDRVIVPWVSDPFSSIKVLVQ